MCVHIDPYYGIHLRGVYVHVGSIVDTSPIGHVSLPYMHMHFLYYGLLAVGCVLTYYSHRCKICKHVSMLDTLIAITNCMNSKMHAVMKFIIN